jgi:hypothetical protein
MWRVNWIFFKRKVVVNERWRLLCDLVVAIARRGYHCHHKVAFHVPNNSQLSQLVRKSAAPQRLVGHTCATSQQKRWGFWEAWLQTSVIMEISHKYSVDRRSLWGGRDELGEGVWKPGRNVEIRLGAKAKMPPGPTVTLKTPVSPRAQSAKLPFWIIFSPFPGYLDIKRHSLYSQAS